MNISLNIDNKKTQFESITLKAKRYNRDNRIKA